jgi:hypothetical protein
MTAAAMLVAGNLAAGFLQKVAAWPFACYPTFATLSSGFYPTLQVVVERPEQPSVTLDGARVGVLVGLQSHQVSTAVALYLANDAGRPARLTELANRVWERLDNREAVASMRVERVVLSTAPDKRGDPPIDPPEALLEWSPSR